MLVSMLVTTNFQGLKEIGNEYNVPSDVAARWVTKGIAALSLVAVAEEATETPDILQEQESVLEISDYASMKPKALYALCKDRGIELDKDKFKQKSYLIEMLTAE